MINSKDMEQCRYCHQIVPDTKSNGLCVFCDQTDKAFYEDLLRDLKRVSEKLYTPVRDFLACQFCTTGFRPVDMDEILCRDCRDENGGL